ncbi:MULTISPECIES: hypothetical protein [Pseudomonas]|nr:MULTISPECIES: hypothetical protein [Pseudomonas]MCP1455288.1 hypothetical protein [Pseudomonas kilonensis]UVM63350.1 hypothetical protein LOY50_10015 [Pseudomonas sp. B21-010]
MSRIITKHIREELTATRSAKKPYRRQTQNHGKQKRRSPFQVLRRFLLFK